MTRFGERLKADALTLVADRRAVYVRRGQRALLTALLAVGQATADDVRDALDLPPGIDPVCLGAVPLALARAGIIRRVGYSPTCRPTAHARPVSVWTLADRAAAMRWLDTHPDLPDPGDDDQEACSQRVLFPLEPTNEPGAAVAAAAPGMEE
jgi:hypothetical protein